MATHLNKSFYAAMEAKLLLYGTAHVLAMITEILLNRHPLTIGDKTEAELIKNFIQNNWE